MEMISKACFMLLCVASLFTVVSSSGMTDTTDKLFWFIQISDIHISAYQDPSRGTDLLEWCRTHIPLIRPKLVLVTGDMTHAKTPYEFGSAQSVQEWQTYHDIIVSSGVLDLTEWLDIRGNHDSFNTASDGSDDFFRRFSVQGPAHNKHYRRQLSFPFGRYGFVAMDATPLPGLRRPYNWFGRLTDESVATLRQLDQESLRDNLTVWFGHYPSNCIISDVSPWSLMRSASVYLCGHLHTLGDLFWSMYARVSRSQLELELADWKHHRYYRIVAVDHDTISFVDVLMNRWPVILVTNPKPARFRLAGRERVDTSLDSSHIRLLIFSPMRVSHVQVWIDDTLLGNARQAAVGQPLWLLAWSPAHWSSGFHQLRVDALDESGKSTSVSYIFSLDGSIEGLGLHTTLVLTMPIVSLFSIGYVLVLFVSAGSLLLLRFSDFPITGPWYIGHFVGDSFGVMFSFGFLVQGQILAETFSFISAVVQVVTFNIPASLLIGFQLSELGREHADSTSFVWGPHRLLPSLVFSLLSIWQIWMIVSTSLQYGLITVLGPVRTGQLLWFWLCWHRVSLERSSKIKAR